MKVSFYTFGCTVNNYETQIMRTLFAENGYELSDSGDSDIHIVNSCAITGSAEKGVVSLISRLRKKNPNAIIAMVGCYGESLKKSGKHSIPDVDIILDNKKQGLLDEVNRLVGAKQLPQSSPSSPESPRALLQVQTGCNTCCTYCVVPKFRGPSVSKPFSEFETELDDLVNRGYKEIVLAGLNLGFYEDGDYRLIDLMKATDKHKGVASFRLSSLEPMNLGDSFTTELGNFKKLAPHLHISLQSGCDHTLQMMNRKHSFQQFLDLITEIRTSIPGISISTDIIVGFPGESEKDFGESMNNVIKCNFSEIHIFKYSQRNGTVAAQMENQITEHQKIKRSLVLKGIKMQARYNFNSQFVGKTEQIILLKKLDNNKYEGLTVHNVQVIVDTKADIPLDIYQAKITALDENQETLYAKLSL